MKGLYALAGLKHRPEVVKAHFATLKTGAPLTLRRDPGNQYDRNAVQVWSDDMMIGFIASKQNVKLAMAMDAMSPPREGINLFRPLPAKLAVDGGKWPLIEIEE